MEHIPYETVTVWMRQQPHLNPRRLLPALLKYDPTKLSDKTLPVKQKTPILYVFLLVIHLL